MDLIGPDEDEVNASGSSVETETEETETKKPGRERGPDGKFAPKTTEEEETTETVKDDTPEKSEEANQPAVPEVANPVDYAKAIAALHRDGTPPSVIDSMKPDEIVLWGLR